MSARDGDPRPVSREFKLAEYTHSPTAVANKWHNDPLPHQVTALQLLHARVIVPLIDGLAQDFGLAPAVQLVMNSGFRSERVNRAVGGQAGSQHMKGEAVDVEAVGLSNMQLGRWIEKNILDFDQLGYEFVKAHDPRAGWIHISYVDTPARNRRMLFRVPRR